MRKHLIGTILVLAALAACNKEIDTQTPAIVDPVEETPAGKVTLTFKATIGEETRTVYANDKTASWAAGDKISVRVTDGTNFETAEFSTTDGETFTGQVTNGYTTIVSGVYPANENHVFSGGSVQSVYLKDTYDLGTANDGGIALPMVGEMKKKDGVDTFTFHHICGALKIEIVDIFNALTFTTAGETITGGFELDEETGRIKMPENGTSSTVTFNYGRLSTNPTVGERKNRTFYIPVPDGTLTAGATMALKKSNSVTVYEKTTPQSINFSSKIMCLSPIQFKTPSGWSLAVHEVDPGNRVTIDNNVPSGTKFVRFFMKKSTFESTYQGSIAQFAELKIPELSGFSNSSVYTTGSNIEAYYNETYVEIICGVNQTAKSGRMITFDFCIIEWSFEEPTQDYLNWIGKWSVDDGEATDTWTITRKQANKSYTVTGLCDNTKNPKKVEAIFNNGKLKFVSQYDFASFVSSTNGKTYQVSLVMVNSSGNPQFNNYNSYSIMQASIPNEGTSTLSSLISNYSRYNLIAKQTHETTSYSNYGTARKLPATMTRVTE